MVRLCRVRSTRLTGRASSRVGRRGPAPLRRGWKSCWRSLEGGILAADFAGVVPARRGAHCRPLHPRLAPLASGNRRNGEIAHRYQVLQEYRRYAGQLSTMTREEAQRAVDIGLNNLARTAGYPDPLRLEWALEAESVKDLAHGPVSAAKDGVTVTLALDASGRPEITVCRGDKELKSIPPPLSWSRFSKIAMFNCFVPAGCATLTTNFARPMNGMCIGLVSNCSEIAFTTSLNS